MPLSANSRLGPYEIRSRLGVGGMGEVYRARDSRLNRDVAIKVIRADGTLRIDGRNRFEREARAAAALNHPNIVGIYDFGVEEGQQYIVEELIEGESLGSLLTGKPIPLRKLLDIATQVADGLTAAHAVGLVHRDLKPENIMLAKDGRVKILDFGLARQDKSPKPSSSDLERALAPTATTFTPGHDPENITHLGTVLGTPNYMSPEQALGEATDYRSDQFSFGLILYELATGKRAFAKRSTIETMAAIVGEEPPAIDERVPPPLRWIIEHCLQKERERRYESTRDLYWELRNLGDHFSETSTGALARVVPPVKPRRWKIHVFWAACMLLAGLLAYLLRPSGQNIGSYRYTPFATDTSGKGIWSPDGRALAYASKVNGTFQVFLRFLNSPVPVQLTQEKLDTVPFGWSSDRGHLIVGEANDTVGILTHYKLYSIPTVGGQPEFLMDADCIVCELSRDGKFFATITYTDVEISDPIGVPLRPYKPDPFNSSVKGTTSDPSLSVSPDGKQILLLLPVGDKQDEAWLLAYPPASGSPRQISILNTLRFSASYPTSSWMPDNRSAAISIQADQNSALHLWLADTKSNNLSPLTTGTNDERSPSVSPDGKSILYSLITRRFDVTSVSVEDGSTKTLITTGHEEFDAAWSANQQRLVWVSNRRGPWEIWIRLPDGSDRPAITAADVPAGLEYLSNPLISPDGERIIYEASGGGMGDRMWISSVNGGSPVPLTNTPNPQEWGGSWSPDGSRFFYLQSDNGASDLMIVKTSGNATPRVLRKNVHTDGLYLPDWSPSGEWITYHDKNGWWLISPDGKTSKSLGKIETPYLVFSKNGRLVYGIDTGERGFPTRATLFSLDLATLRQKVIRELGKDLAPQSPQLRIRLSMAPDGKTFAYSTWYYREDLWMLTGYRQPGWRGRISDALGLK